jgi:penicillin-binding protein-related factor A (putative recombinase)
MAFSLSGIFNGDYTTFPLKETNQLCLYSRKQIDERTMDVI